MGFQKTLGEPSLVAEGRSLLGKERVGCHKVCGVLRGASELGADTLFFLSCSRVILPVSVDEVSPRPLISSIVARKYL